MMLSTNAKPAGIVIHEAPSYSSSGLRILCATDLSARSDRAVERAIRLSEAVGAQCMLLHVVTNEVPIRLAGRRAERAHEALVWHARQLSQLRAKPIVSVRVGARDSTISRVAKDWGANLIVLGAHRRRSMESLRRSTAERVLSRAGCPVLTVNADASRDYNGVTFIARKNIGAYVRLTDQFELFDTAHVAVIPHASMLERILLACSRISRSSITKFGSPAAASKLLQRLHRRTQRWVEEAGLHLMGFEIVAPPLTARSLLSEVTQGKNPQLLVAEVDRMSSLTGSLARTAAVIAVRTGNCDVLMASARASRSALRMPRFSAPQEPCENAIC
jgi:nucleotide-binding universal stress UspA family protein